MNISKFILRMALIATVSSVAASTDKPRRLRLANNADTDTNRLLQSSMSMATESINKIGPIEQVIDAIVSKLGEEGEAVDPAALMLALADALEGDESMHWGYEYFSTEKCLKLLFILLPDYKASKLSFICGGETVTTSTTVSSTTVASTTAACVPFLGDCLAGDTCCVAGQSCASMGIVSCQMGDTDCFCAGVPI